MAETTDVTPAPSWPTLKTMDPNVQEFEANGKLYRVYRSVSLDRYEAYEILQEEIGLARSFPQIIDGLREAYDLCNKVATGKPVFADLAVTLRDMLIGTTLVGEKQTHAVLKLAALFINREGEDITTINEELINSKVSDWKAAGIDMSFFFQFALRSIPGYIEAYRATSRDTSLLEAVAKENAGATSTSRAASRPSSASTTD